MTEKTLVLLHTNDIHGHFTPWLGWEAEMKGRRFGGFDRLASVVAKERKKHPDRVLLLDAGDFLGDTMLMDLTRGMAGLEFANYLGYDALVIGNHEPDFDPDHLRKWIAGARFPVLGTNLLEKKSGALFRKPYVVREVNGIKVGILGLAYPNTPKTTAPKNVAGLVFEDPITTCEKYLPRLRKDGATVVVVLAHLGLGAEIDLARKVPGIDVVIGGHSHNRTAKPIQVKETLVVQAGAHGSDVGRLELRLVRDKLRGHSYDLISLDHETIPSDPDALKLLEKVVSPHRKQMEEVIGQAKTWLVRAQTLAGQEPRKRDAESPVDCLFADILREQTGADLAFLPGVGYGVAIPPGSVSAAQLRQLTPHESKVVTIRLTGKQIKDILEQDVENVFAENPANKVGGMIQVSGLRFTYDPLEAFGKRIQEVKTAGGNLDRERMFKVATNSMLAEGGHNYRTFLEGKDRTEHGRQFEMVREWFGKHSPVSTPAPGRIRKAR